MNKAFVGKNNRTDRFNNKGFIVRHIHESCSIKRTDSTAVEIEDEKLVVESGDKR